jgi:hypothetical protein
LLCGCKSSRRALSASLLLPCRYGKDWNKYCSIVKKRIVPYVY